jgi:protein SCO1/2
MKRFLFIFLILIIAVPVAYFMNKETNSPELPFVNPSDLPSEMVDSAVQNIGRDHKIGSFQLIDENQKQVTEDLIRGKVFVAEYFFTTCGSICPIMNKQMQRVQSKFKNNNHFKILSFTVDPEHDNSEQLKIYAKKHNYNSGQWHFITGDKKALYSLARKSFFVLKPAEAENLGDAGNDFIHTNNFVLVDQQGHIRGYYDGTNKNEVDQLLLDIEKLLDAQ